MTRPNIIDYIHEDVDSEASTAAYIADLEKWADYGSKLTKALALAIVLLNKQGIYSPELNTAIDDL